MEVGTVKKESRRRRALYAASLYGVAFHSWLPPSNAFYVEVETYPFDLERAQAELDAAGYEMSGDVRQDPDGQPLRVTLSFPPDIASRASQLLISCLEPLEIEIEPQSLDRPSLNARTAEGNYELALINYGGLRGTRTTCRRSFRLRKRASNRCTAMTIPSSKSWPRCRPSFRTRASVRK
jgi:ABC-type transport system substrate-binding protein